MKITTNDIYSALEEWGREQPKRPEGKGWATYKEMAKKQNVSVARTKMRMQVALRNGLKVERFTGSEYDEMGVLRKQTWFRVKI